MLTNVDKEDILNNRKMIDQVIITIRNNKSSLANKIPRNEAYPLPPLKFFSHIGKICPTRIKITVNKNLSG